MKLWFFYSLGKARTLAASIGGSLRRPNLTRYQRSFVFVHFWQNFDFSVRLGHRAYWLPTWESPWGGQQSHKVPAILYLFTKTFFHKTLLLLFARDSAHTGCQHWRVPEEAESHDVLAILHFWGKSVDQLFGCGISDEIILANKQSL